MGEIVGSLPKNKFSGDCDYKIGGRGGGAKINLTGIRVRIGDGRGGLFEHKQTSSNLRSVGAQFSGYLYGIQNAFHHFLRVQIGRLGFIRNHNAVAQDICGDTFYILRQDIAPPSHKGVAATGDR